MDPKNLILLYLGSSATIAKDETGLIKNINNYLKSSKNILLRKIQIIIRPHPMNAAIFDKLGANGFIVFPKGGNLPGTNNDIQLFFDTIYHSIATVGINTSGMIDAVILNKPVVAFMVDEYKNTQELALHFQHLVKNDVIETVKSLQELSKIISLLAKGIDKKKKQRIKFVKKFIRPFGLEKSAGEKTAEIIENTALGKVITLTKLKNHTKIQRANGYHTNPF